MHPILAFLSVPPVEQAHRVRRLEKQEVQELLTDLDHWFMAFARAMNTIIHEGIVPSLTHAQPGTPYGGHFGWTGDYLSVRR
jgi:hypothetical protein